MVSMSFVGLSFLLRFVGGGDVFVVTLSLLRFFVGGKLLRFSLMVSYCDNTS
jgi:hypothetical protein